MKNYQFFPLRHDNVKALSVEIPRKSFSTDKKAENFAEAMLTANQAYRKILVTQVSLLFSVS